jgi:hypothetical protein
MIIVLSIKFLFHCSLLKRVSESLTIRTRGSYKAAKAESNENPRDEMREILSKWIDEGQVMEYRRDCRIEKNLGTWVEWLWEHQKSIVRVRKALGRYHQRGDERGAGRR